MKKQMAACLLAIVWCVMITASVSAATTTAVDPVGATVYVTIADENGALVMTTEGVALSDRDGDRQLTVNDALIAAHEQYHAEGADAYETVNTGNEAAIARLWGAQSTVGFECVLNDAPAVGLTDAVSDGDRVTAFVYTDAALSDVYTYFDAARLNVTEKEAVTLTLKSVTRDRVIAAVEGATITVDGERTDFVTDANGKVTLTLSGGNHVISAVSDTQVLVPPVCKVMAAVDSTDELNTAPTTAPETTTTVIYGAPRDGGPTFTLSMIGIGAAIVVLVIGIVCIARKRA